MEHSDRVTIKSEPGVEPGIVELETEEDCLGTSTTPKMRALQFDIKGSLRAMLW